MRPTRAGAAAAVAAFALAAALGGCGDDDKDPVPPPSAPPKATATSPVFGVPLPEAAKPNAEKSKPSFESFYVPADAARFADVEAFYRQELDERPFRDLAWCGTTVDDRGVYAVRVWKREGGDDVFVLSLRSDPAVGVEINAAQTKDANQQCPPPAIDQ
jgi:hypothetical protein